MTKASQIGWGRGPDWWAEGRKDQERCRRGGAENGWGWGCGVQSCSSITSHSGPGVGFSKTDSERSGLDSISHKSWHVTLMDVGHKAPCSDMWRATWRTMGKCECSRLMSTRPGSEKEMMEGRRGGDVQRSEVWRGGLRRMSWLRTRCEKRHRVYKDTVTEFTVPSQ